MTIARKSKQSIQKPSEDQLTEWYWCALSNGYFNTAKLLAEMGAVPLKPTPRDFLQFLDMNQGTSIVKPKVLLI